MAHPEHAGRNIFPLRDKCDAGYRNGPVLDEPPVIGFALLALGSFTVQPILLTSRHPPRQRPQSVRPGRAGRGSTLGIARGTRNPETDATGINERPGSSPCFAVVFYALEIAYWKAPHFAYRFSTRNNDLLTFTDKFRKQKAIAQVVADVRGLGHGPCFQHYSCRKA